MPRRLPDLPPELLQRQRELEQRLLAPLQKTFYSILDGENNAAATWALVQVTANIIFAVLDRVPPPVRTEFIQSIRAELEVSRKKPGGMSMKTYLEGPFELNPPPDRIH
jgi:hypothetical protein